MPIISFYEQADPDKMVRKACFIVDDNSEQGAESAVTTKSKDDKAAEDSLPNEVKEKNLGPLYVDFNPSTIKMNTGKGRKVNGTEPPSKSLPSGRDPDFDKCYTARKFPFDTSTTVEMTLIFDAVSKWDNILSGNDEEAKESRLESSYVGRFFKSWNSASKAGKSFVSGTMAAISTILAEDVTNPLKLKVKQVGDLKNSVTGAISNVRNNGLGGVKDIGMSIGKGMLSNLKGEKYMSKLERCNLFYETSTYRRLEDAYLNRGKVLFLWGPMRFYGTIRNFNTTFSMFTRAGSPLRAQTNISIELFREVNKDTLNINVINEKYKEAAWIDEMYEEYVYPKVQNALKMREDIKSYVSGGGKNIAEKATAAAITKGLDQLASSLEDE